MNLSTDYIIQIANQPVGHPEVLVLVAAMSAFSLVAYSIFTDAFEKMGTNTNEKTLKKFSLFDKFLLLSTVLLPVPIFAYVAHIVPLYEGFLLAFVVYLSIHLMVKLVHRQN
jgi:hypothetical protein